jgi:Raf kinase inhibitor-like YbhB/YbcL family protein
MAARTKSRGKASPSKAKGHRIPDLGFRSLAFGAGESIPVRYTADGQNISPPLSWDEPPEGTRVLALVCEDSDAPMPEPFVHWLVANLNPEQSGRELVEGATVLSGAVLGKNSFGFIEYGGPEPPRGHGIHHYYFTLFALDAPVELAAGFSKEDLLRAAKGHVLAKGECIGTYRR